MKVVFMHMERLKPMKGATSLLSFPKLRGGIFIKFSQWTKGEYASPTCAATTGFWTHFEQHEQRGCEIAHLFSSSPFQFPANIPRTCLFVPKFHFNVISNFFSSDRSAVEMEWGRLSVKMKWFSSSEAKGGGGGGGGSEPIRLLKVERLDSVAVNRWEMCDGDRKVPWFPNPAPGDLLHRAYDFYYIRVSFCAKTTQKAAHKPNLRLV